MPDPTVECIALSNIALTGTPVVDTYQTAPGSRVAVAGNTNPVENGVYDVPVGGGAWPRSADFSTGAQMAFPARFAVKYGSNDNAGAEFYFANRTAPTVGTDPITINRRSWPVPFDAGAGLSRNIGALSLSSTGVLPGQYTNISGEVDEFGRLQTAAGSSAASTFMEGLRLSRVSGTTVRVATGSAFVLDPGGVLDLALDATLTPGLAVNTTYHVYFFQSGATAALEVSTQVPATAYRGTARVKGGPDNTTPDAAPDNTRRWLGQFTTDAAAAIIQGSIISAGDDAGAAIGYFSAYRNTDQTGVVSATPTRVQFGAVEVAHPWYADTGANTGRYTPLRAGIYAFMAAVTLSAPAVDQSRVVLNLYKNGTIYKALARQHTSGTTGQAIAVSGGCWASANGSTDFFEIYVLHSYGTNQTIAGGAELTWVQATLSKSL